MIEIGNIVNVLDVSNYSSNYSEKTPFKAVLIDVTGYPCYWVTSTITGNTYELYGYQILEIDGDPDNY